MKRRACGITIVLVMITLGIETSAAEGGVALCDDGRTLVDLMMGTPLQHAEELLPLVSDALDRCRMSVSDIGLVSVNSGPGSFTGLRIGLAAAKGICQAAGIPLVGVTGWQILRTRVSDGTVACAVIENRRDLYYAKWIAGKGSTEAVVLSGDELIDMICAERRRVKVIGSGAASLRDRLADCRLADCAPEGENGLSAVDVARIGAEAFTQDQLYDLQPVYVEPVLARMN